MRRRFLIVLLTLGTVGGFASGFHHLWHHHGHARQWERGWERHHDCTCEASSCPS
jgi:hypothetical protein